LNVKLRALLLWAGLLLGLVLLPSIAHAQQSGSEPRPGTGQKLVVGTKVAKPFAFKNADGQWTGISIDLWNEINAQLGYEIEWREAQNTNELIDQVSRREIDVAIAAITMTPDRAERVDFSNSMYESGLGIAVRAENPGVLSVLASFASLKLLAVIGGLLGGLLAVGTMIWFVERKKNPDFEDSPGKGIWSGFWWSAVTMTTVGYGDKTPRTPAGRVLALLWMFASIIAISGFTATVASALTAERIESSVNSAADLSRVKVGAKRSESPAQVLEQMGIVPVPFGSIEEGLLALRSGEIGAFVHDTPVVQYDLLNDPRFVESLLILPKPVRVEEYGIAVAPPEDRSKRNELRDQINQVLLARKTSGKYGEIVRRYLDR
jgi:ABC-type amino acid transport substrate-binding protein